MRSRGVTLVELLISMLILGFVLSLVSQAVYQVGQIVRVADESQQQMVDRWSEGWSLQQTMASLVAPREGMREGVFQGRRDTVEAYSTVSPLAQRSDGVQRFELSLRASSRRPGFTELSYRLRAADWVRDSGAEPLVVAWFPGDAVFSFQNRRGEWLEQWRPVAGDDERAERLPSAVRISDRRSGGMLITYPVLASATFQRGGGLSPFGMRDGS